MYLSLSNNPFRWMYVHICSHHMQTNTRIDHDKRAVSDFQVNQSINRDHHAISCFQVVHPLTND